MKSPQPNCRLYVGNIDFRMTRADVKDLFSDAGHVVDVFFPRCDEDDKRPHRGYIFVEMGSAEEALVAIKEFHGTEDDFGRELIVRVADMRRTRNDG